MPYSRKPNESGKSDTTEIPILRKRRFAKCNNGKLDTLLFFDHILIIYRPVVHRGVSFTDIAHAQ